MANWRDHCKILSHHQSPSNNAITIYTVQCKYCTHPPFAHNRIWSHLQTIAHRKDGTYDRIVFPLHRKRNTPKRTETPLRPFLQLRGNCHMCLQEMTFRIISSHRSKTGRGGDAGCPEYNNFYRGPYDYAPELEQAITRITDLTLDEATKRKEELQHKIRNLFKGEGKALSAVYMRYKDLMLYVGKAEDLDTRMTNYGSSVNLSAKHYVCINEKVERMEVAPAYILISNLTKEALKSIEYGLISLRKTRSELEPNPPPTAFLNTYLPYPALPEGYNDEQWRTLLAELYVLNTYCLEPVTLENDTRAYESDPETPSSSANNVISHETPTTSATPSTSNYRRQSLQQETPTQRRKRPSLPPLVVSNDADDMAPQPHRPHSDRLAGSVPPTPAIPPTPTSSMASLNFSLTTPSAPTDAPSSSTRRDTPTTPTRRDSLKMRDILQRMAHASGRSLDELAISVGRSPFSGPAPVVSENSSDDDIVVLFQR